MKITAINTYFVRPRWGFVEIITNDGTVGWGEAVLEGHAGAVLSCVEEMKDYLIGQDPGTHCRRKRSSGLFCGKCG